MSTTAVPGRPGRRGAGRPRHVIVATTLSARDQILDAAGRLFVARGFAATSTREVAEACGIRQASIYYHFPSGKEEILADLLQSSVRPSLDKVEKIEGECPADVPETALYLLALIDVDTLATVPHNIGKLYRMPDVRGTVVFHEFEPALQQLSTAYGRLGAAVASGPVADSISVNQLGTLLVQAVEGVVRTRTSGDEVTSAQACWIAATSLRMCGVPENRIALAASIAQDRMAVLKAKR